MRQRTTALLACALLAAGCAAPTSEPAPAPSPTAPATSQEPPDVSTPTPADPSSDPTDAPTAPTTPTTPTAPVDPTAANDDPGLADAVQAAVADLADELGVAPDGIEVEVAEAVQWPDGALGCPTPGTAYTQAVVDGTRIVLKSNGASYSYHGVRGGVPVVCASPQVPPPIR